MTDVPATRPNRDEIALVLGVLSAVEGDSKVTQRGLSSELGIALGLVNAVLKRCARKGLIKIANAPLNRYTYYLTPSGFAEKSRLTVEYFRYSFDLFRDARRQYGELFEAQRGRGRTALALIGACELAEAAMLSARETGIEIVGIADATRSGERFLGFVLAANGSAFVGRAQALAICDMQDPSAAHERTLAEAATMGLAATDVIVPAILRLQRKVLR